MALLVLIFAWTPSFLGASASSPASQVAPAEGIINIEEGLPTKWFLFVDDGSGTGIIYDVYSHDEESGIVHVMSDNGTVQPFKLKDPNASVFRKVSSIKVPWHIDDNLPICMLDEHPRLVALNATASWLMNGVGGLILFGFLIVLHILSAVGANRATRLWWIIATVIFFNLASIGTAFYPRYRERCDAAATLVNSHRTSNTGLLLPIQVEDASVAPLIQTMKDGEEFETGTIFLLLPLIPLLRLLWSAWVGVHYLFARHPVEKVFTPGETPGPEMVAAMGQEVDLDNPPPVYKSENWRRRVEALQGRVDAETDLLRSGIKNRRARAESDDD